MNRQWQQGYTPGLRRRLNIDGTPVNSKFFQIRSARPETAAKTERVTGKGEQRVSDRSACQK